MTTAGDANNNKNMKHDRLETTTHTTRNMTTAGDDNTNDTKHDNGKDVSADLWPKVKTEWPKPLNELLNLS